MSPEVPLQYDFTGDLMDNRTPKQKRKARQANGWQQSELFSQKDLAQFGVSAHPEIPAIARDGEPLRMVLQIQDPRTDEEKAQDQQRAAEQQTNPMFATNQEEKNTAP